MGAFGLLTSALSLVFAIVSGTFLQLIFLLIVFKTIFQTFRCILWSFVGERLNDFVSHFEPLNYDKSLLENRHQRVRRSLDRDSALHLNFKAHGRYF